MNRSICGAWTSAISSNTGRVAACGRHRKTKIPLCSTRPHANPWLCLGRSTFAPANWSPCSVLSSTRTPLGRFSTCLRAIAAAVSRPYWFLTMPPITMRPIPVGVHFNSTFCRPTAPSSIPLSVFGNCCADWRRTTNTLKHWKTLSWLSKDKSLNSNTPILRSEICVSEIYPAKIKSLCIVRP